MPSPKGTKDSAVRDASAGGLPRDKAARALGSDGSSHWRKAATPGARATATATWARRCSARLRKPGGDAHGLRHRGVGRGGRAAIQAIEGRALRKLRQRLAEAVADPGPRRRTAAALAEKV